MLKYLIAALLFATPALAAGQYGNPEFRLGTIINGVAVAQSLADLQALTPGGDIKVVTRYGYSTAGDGLSSSYVGSASACTVNAGAGDNETQVKPTSGSGCWLAMTNTQSATQNFGNQSGAGICLGCNTTLGTHGLFLQAQNANGWGVVQNTQTYSETQWQVYSNFAQATATANGTATLTLSGWAVNSAWVGLPFAYYSPTGNGFGTRYTVTAVNTGSNTVTLGILGGGAPTFASGTGDFFFGADVSTSVANVSGTAVTWVSGEPFSPFAAGGTTTVAVINGTQYVVNSSTAATLTLSTSAGTITNATVVMYTQDYDTLSLFRVQMKQGLYAEEEMFIGARAIGDFEIRVGSSGTGVFRPLVIGNGYTGSPYYFSYDQIVVQPDGGLTLGGSYGEDTMRVTSSPNSGATNYLYVPYALSGSNLALAARANGSDSYVNINFDTYGTGSVLFTSHSFGDTEFAVYGNGAADYLSVGSNAGSPTLAANGTDANVNINFLPKGTGVLQLNGSPGVTCSGAPSSSFTSTKGLVTHC